ncbi:hypothetical protein SKAU_G00414320 [Synaphobranchus kaupii]|uniref:Uncharacterized protein n=1 Tax=Synaphobranchus kaupii TaxID=118154 RepID=A0A9Q1E706_SYNKA|nr:hypothetical protein SKAU_G00414320 [Synaphobranchus kaupii]
MQIKTRVEHVNRNNTLARRRQERNSCSETAEGGRNMSRGPVDQYGCVRWQPEDLPSGETEETLEDLRRQMLQLYLQEGMAGADRGDLQKWLEITYILQRRFLNGIPPPSISDVKDTWPFLFSQRGLYSHFHLLTNIPILQRLPEAIGRRGHTILKFFQGHKSNSEVEKSWMPFKRKDNKAMCTILLLLAHFKEAKEGIFLQADRSATAADIQRSAQLPSTPLLIVQGETLMKPDAWLLSIEGQVVMGPHNNITNGMAALFASYYNFNLKYLEEAACTLEFVQRGFMGINPQTGSKAASGKVMSRKTGKVVEKKRGAINPHVCTLLRKLMDFEWMEM